MKITGHKNPIGCFIFPRKLHLMKPKKQRFIALAVSSSFRLLSLLTSTYHPYCRFTSSFFLSHSTFQYSNSLPSDPFYFAIESLHCIGIVSCMINRESWFCHLRRMVEMGSERRDMIQISTLQQMGRESL